MKNLPKDDVSPPPPPLSHNVHGEMILKFKGTTSTHTHTRTQCVLTNICLSECSLMMVSSVVNPTTLNLDPDLGLFLSILGHQLLRLINDVNHVENS